MILKHEIIKYIFQIVSLYLSQWEKSNHLWTKPLNSLVEIMLNYWLWDTTDTAHWHKNVNMAMNIWDTICKRSVEVLVPSAECALVDKLCSNGAWWE